MQKINLGAVNTLATNLAHKVLDLTPEQFGQYGITFDILRLNEQFDEEDRPYIICAIDVKRGGDRIAKLIFDFHFTPEIRQPYEIKITFTNIAREEDSLLYMAVSDSGVWKVVPKI